MIKLVEEINKNEQVMSLEKRKECFCKDLDNEIMSNDIICIETSKPELKQIALNHMLKKCYVCVQNDVLSTNSTVRYLLTFAKRNISGNFI